MAHADRTDPKNDPASYVRKPSVTFAHVRGSIHTEDCTRDPVEPMVRHTYTEDETRENQGVARTNPYYARLIITRIDNGFYMVLTLCEATLPYDVDFIIQENSVDDPNFGASFVHPYSMAYTPADGNVIHYDVVTLTPQDYRLRVWGLSEQRSDPEGLATILTTIEPFIFEIFGARPTDPEFVRDLMARWLPEWLR